MRVEDLGKRATFLIPSIKVYNSKYSRTRQSVARTIHRFLIEVFGGYTCASGNIYGYFTSESVEYDELREFRVAFLEDEEKTKFPKLQKFLAHLCADIGEECIYLECGEDAMLIYPDKEEGYRFEEQKSHSLLRFVRDRLRSKLKRYRFRFHLARQVFRGGLDKPDGT